MSAMPILTVTGSVQFFLGREFLFRLIESKYSISLSSLLVSSGSGSGAAVVEVGRLVGELGILAYLGVVAVVVLMVLFVSSSSLSSKLVTFAELICLKIDVLVLNICLPKWLHNN